MSRRTGAAPKLAPALPLEVTAEKPAARTADATLASRNFDVAVEVIRTPCGRVIERVAVVVQLTVRGNAFRGEPSKTIESIAHDNTYRLWEPVVGEASYAVTKTTAGHTWGLAHTRRPKEKIIDLREAAAWEIQQEARAVAVIRANCLELAGKVGDATFDCCGVIRLLGNPRIHAERTVAARKARPC